jgi:hypothetical protein
VTPTPGFRLDRSWFIQSRRGNIKDQYFFEKKLGSGGYGAVYLAMNKQTGTFISHISALTYLTRAFYFSRREGGCESYAEG